jgi:AcrR family transcriptional regulator
MPEGVKGAGSRVPRRYTSPRREQQAAATRRSVLDAATARFEADGYAATTMEAIATDAGVSLKTVYLVFETKSRLLRAVWDLALKGDESDAPVADRSWYIDVLQEADPSEKLRKTAHNSRIAKERIGGLLAAIRDGASTDLEVRELWVLIQSDFLANQRAIVESLRKARGLARGLSVDRATDILWTLNHPDVWLLLVGQRGWTPAQFEKWLGDSLCAQLLDDR